MHLGKDKKKENFFYYTGCALLEKILCIYILICNVIDAYIRLLADNFNNGYNYIN